MSELNNTAAPQAAGYIFQLERALHHLSCADADAWVAVEYIDDVSVLRKGRVALQEQDKSASISNRVPLSDRSKLFWRTLQIWTDQRFGNNAISCDKYLLVFDYPAMNPTSTLIKRMNRGEIDPVLVVKHLRSVGACKSQSAIQKMIDDVLHRSDEQLLQVFSSIEIVESSLLDFKWVANKLAIDARANANAIIYGLLGWLTHTLREMWRQKLPGMISRKACIQQCRELERSQARQRFLPRPAREISVSKTARQSALVRPFVEHLSRIEACDDDIYQAVEHFIQFNVEKHRLAAEGEIPDCEWEDRGDRLKLRWRNIMRSARREQAGIKSQEVGMRVLERSTYEHFEPLSGEACAELYMTSGHYHRLADIDEVWWCPLFKPEVK